MIEIFQKDDSKKHSKQRRPKAKSPETKMEPSKRWMQEMQNKLDEEKELGAASANIKLTLLNSTRTHWVPNRNAKQCSKCYKEFGFFRRRHHCRICGQVFCSGCCDKRKVSYPYPPKYYKDKNKTSRDKTEESAMESLDNTPIRI